MRSVTQFIGRVALATLALNSLTFAAEPRAIGDKTLNGGSLVNKDGRYVTFYQAGLYVAPVSPALLPFQIPELLKLQEYIQQLTLLSDESRSRLLAAIIPTTTRMYYVADPKQLTPEVRARLLEEFRRVTKVDPANLRLGALTDTPAKSTFLLPEFFDDSVSETARMAILFHEAYWLLNPQATYNEVVNAEMAFQAALENPGNASLMYDFLRYVGTKDEAFQAMVKWEIQAGYLNGFLQNGNQFKVGQLISPEFEACLARTGRPVLVAFMGNVISPSTCAPYFQMHLNRLMTIYPQSMLLRSMGEYFNSDSVYGGRGNFVGAFMSGGVHWSGRTWTVARFADPEVYRNLTMERIKDCVVTIDGGERVDMYGTSRSSEAPVLANMKCEGGFLEKTYWSNFQFYRRY